MQQLKKKRLWNVKYLSKFQDKFQICIQTNSNLDIFLICSGIARVISMACGMLLHSNQNKCLMEECYIAFGCGGVGRMRKKKRTETKHKSTTQTFNANHLHRMGFDTGSCWEISFCLGTSLQVPVHYNYTYIIYIFIPQDLICGGAFCSIINDRRFAFGETYFVVETVPLSKQQNPCIYLLGNWPKK